MTKKRSAVRQHNLPLQRPCWKHFCANVTDLSSSSLESECIDYLSKTTSTYEKRREHRIRPSKHAQYIPGTILVYALLPTPGLSVCSAINRVSILSIYMPEVQKDAVYAYLLVQFKREGEQQRPTFFAKTWQCMCR